VKHRLQTRCFYRAHSPDELILMAKQQGRWPQTDAQAGRQAGRQAVLTDRYLEPAMTPDKLNTDWGQHHTPARHSL